MNPKKLDNLNFISWCLAMYFIFWLIETFIDIREKFSNTSDHMEHLCERIEYLERDKENDN